jgi:hypothetical protein
MVVDSLLEPLKRVLICGGVIVKLEAAKREMYDKKMHLVF